jgi:hypothetical protein
VPDREVAARLAALRRASVDIERRLRADDFTAADSAEYWRGQIDAYRAQVVPALEPFPFHQRAIQDLPRTPIDYADAPWRETALQELAEVRTRVDTAIERLG